MLHRPASDSLWADRDFRLYWVSRVISYAGGTITYVAAPILVYALTGSALLTGVTAATEGLPYLLFGLFAGALADRVDRRRVMVGSDLINAVVLATVPIAAALGRLTAAHVIVVGLVTMTVFVFWDAANFGAVPTLVGRDRIREANNAVWGATQVFDVVLPGLVGLVVAWLAPSTLYWVNAFTFLASAFLVRGIVRNLSGERDPDAGRLREDVLTGLRWLWGHTTLRTMTFIGTTVSFSMGAVMGQLVPFADQVLGIRQGDVRLGAVFAVFSLGGLVGTLASRWLRPFTAARVSLVSTSFMAVLIVLIPWPRDYRVTFVLVFLFGVANLISVVNNITFRQEETPEDMQSRVNTTGRMLSWGLGAPAGALVGGIVAHAYGPALGMASGSIVVIVGVALGWTSSLARIPARRDLVRDTA
ncbi:MFS transporter [Longivirga aurantiaca]|uniref:MFS transporter n=1 Tax=Longivirga aurantiaca TaxID=1837743 RepID=A0ABW1T1F3_9ACTN